MVEYTNWQPGQPDDSGGQEGCVETFLSSALGWHDAPCDELRNYICQIPKGEPIKLVHSLHYLFVVFSQNTCIIIQTTIYLLRMLPLPKILWFKLVLAVITALIYEHLIHLTELGSHVWEYLL